jgi:large subunit ribosomal protein L9
MLSKPGAVAVVKAQIEARAETEQARKLAAEIEGKELTFHVKMGVKDRMHGSITAANIATELQKTIGQPVDKRKIELPESIKMLGTYDVAIKLIKGIEPKIKVNVVKKEEEAAKEASPEPAKEPEQKSE